jgi:uncharacterized GH25 family protein
VSRRKRTLNKILSVLMVFLIVSSGLLQPVYAQGTTNLETASADQQSLNVLGKLAQGGASLSGVTLSVQHLTGNQWFNATTGQDGGFGFNLPDGEYKLAGIWLDSQSKWYALDKVFKVSAGKLEDTTALNVDLPPVEGPVDTKNVKGKVTNEGKPLNGITFSIHTTDGTNVWHNATTDENGKFGFELSDGEYKLDGIWVGHLNLWFQLDKVITVENGVLVGESELVIELTPPPPPVKENVTGVVTKDGSPVANVGFSIHTTGDKITWYNTVTNSNGQFSFKDLPDGNYQIDGIWIEAEGKWYQLDKAFSVAGTAEVLIELQKTPPPPTKFKVTGVVTKNSNPFPGIGFSAHTKGEPQQWFNTTTNANGEFSFELPAGEYQVDGIWVDAEGKWYELNQAFTVEGNQTLKLDLFQSVQHGTLTSDGKPVAGEWISVHTTGIEQTWFNAKTNNDGSFLFDLPDGEYQLDGVWVSAESKWYTLGKVFTVKDGKLVDLLNLDIELKVFNVKGSVTKNDNPLSGLWLSLQGPDAWYDAQTDNNGVFKFNLPDGKYQLHGVWVSSESKWYPLQVTFEVVNGKLLNGETLDIDLTEKEPNITGTVTNGTAPVSGVAFSAHALNGEEYWYDAKTDGNGKFNFTLPDGEYQIDGIWVPAESKWYQIEKKFSVKDGFLTSGDQLTINLQAPLGNVNGVITNNDTPVSDVLFSTYSVSDGKWYSTQADKDGNFSLKLPDGQYKIEGIWVSTEQKWYPLQLSFDVAGGVLVGNSVLFIELADEPEGNVKGILKDENGPLANVYIDILNEDTGAYAGNPLTDENGNFSVELEDGDYVAHSIWKDESNYHEYVHTFFSVVNGKLQVNGVETESLAVVLPPESLAVQLVRDGTTLKNIEVEVSYDLRGETYYQYNAADENGKVKFRMFDGEVKIYGYYDNNNGEFHYIDEEIISIKNGTTIPSPYVIDVTEIEDSYIYVDGTVSDSDGFVGDASLWMYNVTTDEWFGTEIASDGSFNIGLIDGDYTELEISGENLNSVYDIAINGNAHSFTVNSGQIIVNGTEVSQFDLTIPKVSLKGQLLFDGSPIQGEVGVSTDTHYWSATTDENGVFELRVADGEYFVTDVFISDRYYTLNQKLVASSAAPETQLIDVQSGNISGRLVDGSNPLVNSHFYIESVDSYWDYYAIYTDENGQFDVDLPDGNYVISHVSDSQWNTIGYADLFFSVTNGEIIVNGTAMETLNVEMPTDSMHVKILNGEYPVEGELNVYREVNGFELSYIANTDANGDFVLRVPDGVYNIAEIYTSADGYKPVNVDVEVINGTTEPSPFVINIENEVTPVGNVQGLLQDENGPLANTTIYIESEWNWDQTVTNANGEFGFDLPDGTYYVTEVWNPDRGTTYLQNFVFNVSGGILVVDGSETNILEVTVPAAPVEGILLDNGEAVPYAGVNVEYTTDIFGRTIHSQTDENGKFLVGLADGEYSITGIWLEGDDIPVNIPFVIENGVVYVNGQGTQLLEVKIPPVNVSGTLVDYNGSGAPDQTITILSLDDAGYYNSYYAYTDQDGQFEIRLPDGDYWTGNVDGESPALLNTDFQVINGKLVLDGIEQSELILNYPESNINGQLVQSGTVLANSFIYLNSENKVGSYEVSFYTNENGMFSYRLADGAYSLQGVSTEDSYYPLSISFEVIDGVPTIDFTTLDIDQFIGTVKGNVLENGIPVSDGNVEITEINTYEYYTASTNENGEFAAGLSDGVYIVNSVYTESNGQYTPVNVEFEVVNGNLYVNGNLQERLNISIPEVSFVGQLVNDGQPLSYATMHIEYDYNGNTNSYYFTTDENGQFAIRLPDGYFHLDYVDSDLGYYDLNRSVVVENGTTNPSPYVIDVSAIEGNVQGFVQDENGPIANAEFYIESYDTWEYIQTNSNGEFGVNLPDGEYSIYDLWSEEEGSVRLDVTFTVENGVLMINNSQAEKLIVTLPQRTLTGVVLDDMGAAAPYAGIQIISADHDHFSYYTDENGHFNGRLSDGEYTVLSVSPESENQVPVNLQFTIKNDVLYVNGVLQEQLEVKLLPVTVTGSMVDENNNPLPDQFFTIKDFGSKNLNSLNVYTDYEGNFELKYPDGDYMAESTSFGENGEYVPLMLLFTISNGVLTVNGEVKDSLTIALPAENFAGQLVEDGSVVTNAFLNLHTSPQMYVAYGFPVRVDENGTFSGRLPDGSYTIDGINTSYDDYRPLYIEFEVVNGITSEDFSILDIGKVYGNVQGVVQDENGPLQFGSIYLESDYDWYTIDVNQYGEFGTELPDGDYKITSYWDESLGDIRLHYNFTVQNGALLVNGNQVEKLDIKIPSLNVKGTIESEEGLVPNATLNVEYLNGEYSESYDVYADENGYFESRFADGSYQVTSVYLEDWSRIPVSLSFEVIDGKVFVDNVEQNSLKVMLPGKSFVGQVIKDDSAVSYASVEISSETDGEYYYTEADENGNFAFRVPDGLYKIFTVHSEVGYKGIYRNVEVINGTTNPNPYILDISDNAPIEGNLKGLVTDSTGPAASVTVDVYGQDWSDWNGVAYSVETNSEGLIGVDVPDGDYTLGYGEETKTAFSMIDGKIFVDGVETSLVELVVPDITLTGVLTKDGLPISDATVVFVGNGQWYDMDTDEDGRFNGRLKDGQYQFAGLFDDEYGYLQLNQIFTIQDGLMYQDGVELNSLQLSPPVGTNITGKLSDGTIGLAYSDIVVMAKLIDGIYAPDYYGTDENGSFNAYLADGDYVVVSAYSEGQSYPINHSFSVVNGKIIVDGQEQSELIVTLSANVVKGTLSMDGGFLLNAEIRIESMFGDRIESFYITTDENGEFSLSYPDGTYRVVEAWSYTVDYFEYPLNTAFTIKDGKVFVDGAEQSALSLEVADQNFTGTVVDGNVPVDGWVSIVLLDTDRHYSVDTDQDGNFSFRLPDGNYRLNSAGSKESDQWKEFNVEFKVENGVTSLSPYTIDVNGF